MIYVTGPKDQHLIPQGSIVVNTTSRSNNWSSGLSPFFVGPVNLYSNYVAQNVENAYQFSKVYSCHVDQNNDPVQVYWDWAIKGWEDKRAHRYPMEKNAKPLYSYWNGKKLNYIEARKEIYIPLYAKAVKKTDAFKQLQNMHNSGQDIYLWDFDGYNHRNLGMSWDDVINNETRKMGHAFVIGMLMDGLI